jgi:tRNA(Ile)-lysidine synthase
MEIPKPATAHAAEMSLIGTVAAVLRRCRLATTQLVVAVSGGPDSLGLLLALRALQDDLALRLVVAHFDHHLRPDSIHDRYFVERVSRELVLEFVTSGADVAALARSEGVGLEEAARLARYRWLGSVCQDLDASAILTGHNADDQTETQLLHVVRGGGLRSLRGMAEDSVLNLPGGTRLRIVRPLLSIGRVALESYCAQLGVTPRRDPSNDSREFARNRLRWEALPALRTVNPRVDRALERLGRIAADAEQFVQDELDRRLPGLAEQRAAEWLIRRAAWETLPAALRRALVRRAASDVGPDDVGADAVEKILNASERWPTGRGYDWPGARRVTFEHDLMRIRRQATGMAVGPVPLAVDPPGVVQIDGFSETNSHKDGRWPANQLVIRTRSESCSGRPVDRWHADFDRAKLEASGKLVVRARRAGDWLCPVGMTGRKKVQDVLVDAHVPRDQRDRLPILVAGEDVVWVVGLRRDRRFVAGPGSREVLCLELGQPEGAEAAR